MEGFESFWKGLATNKVAHQSDKSASFSLRQCFFFFFWHGSGGKAYLYQGAIAQYWGATRVLSGLFAIKLRMVSLNYCWLFF